MFMPIISIVEQGTGITHAFVEPERVEIIAEIVVELDVPARAAAVVAAQGMHGLGQNPGEAARPGYAAQGPGVAHEEIEQGNGIRTVPFARRPCAVPSGRARTGQAEERAPAFELDLTNRAGSAATEDARGAVRKPR